LQFPAITGDSAALVGELNRGLRARRRATIQCRYCLECARACASCPGRCGDNALDMSSAQSPIRFARTSWISIGGALNGTQMVVEVILQAMSMQRLSTCKFLLGPFGGSGDSRQLEPICLREISETSPVVFGGVLCSVLGSFEAEVRRARALDSVFVPGAAGQDFRTCCCSSDGSRVATLQAVRSCFLGTFVL
jgi:hypothetical protein